MDRAIRIHQNLIARPQLPKQQRNEALLALGQDYLRAGVLDRAERLFLELTESGDDYTEIAFHHLLDIYQQQKQWDAAIAIANKIVANNETVKRYIAHYYCELAEEAQRQEQAEQARNYLKQALTTDPKCARASLLQGESELKAAKFKAAVEAFRQVEQQDPDFLPEIIVPLTQCYLQLGEEKELFHYLESCLQTSPQISLVLALADLIERSQGNGAAAEYITSQLRQRPSLRGLQRLIAIQLKTVENGAKENLLILQDLVAKLLKNKPIYRCISCGFSSKILHWFCPGCKNWSSGRPIQGVEGE